MVLPIWTSHLKIYVQDAGKKEKNNNHKRHFWIVLNLISAICPASKNTNMEKFGDQMCFQSWGLNSQGFWQRDSRSGSCQVSRPRITRQEISGKESGVATDTSNSQPPPVSILWAYLLASWTWGAGKSLSLLKNDPSWTLKSNQNELWLLFGVPKWD